MSGVFNVIIGSVLKYGLVESFKLGLFILDLFKNVELLYIEEEKIEYLKKVFLIFLIYNELVLKLFGCKFFDYLDKFLICEFNVDKDSVGRIVNYFIDGVRYVGILNDDNIILLDLIIDELIDVEVVGEYVIILLLI